MTDPAGGAGTPPRWFLLLALLLCGTAWGATQPLSKVAVNGGYQHFGLLFWQGALGAAFMAAGMVATRRRVLLGRPQLAMYALIGLIGAVIPNTASYQALAHIPAGIYSAMMSLIPMVSFPLALALGNDSFRWSRLAGLMAGLAGALLLALPGAGLPPGVPVFWVLVVGLTVFCYAAEGNIVARWGTAGLDPVQLLFGASVVTAMASLPLALASGQFISPVTTWDGPEIAIVAIAALNVAAYSGYVWLVGQAGAVYAVQVGYLVTPIGVLFSMAMLGERYSGFFWLAVVLMLVGVALVQPRPKGALVPGGAIDQTAG